MAILKSLREEQIQALTALLSLNDNTTTISNAASSSTIPTWKVLIMDKLAQDVLATSLRVQDLRDQGVTLHMFVLGFGLKSDSPSLTSSYFPSRQLHSDRPALPDVPAVYFVSPTLANIQRITTDLQKGLYASSYINFTSALSRPLLEEFAETVAKDGTVEGVQQVSGSMVETSRELDHSFVEQLGL